MNFTFPLKILTYQVNINLFFLMTQLEPPNFPEISLKLASY